MTNIATEVVFVGLEMIERDSDELLRERDAFGDAAAPARTRDLWKRVDKRTAALVAELGDPTFIDEITPRFGEILGVTNEFSSHDTREIMHVLLSTLGSDTNKLPNLGFVLDYTLKILKRDRDACQDIREFFERGWGTKP